MSYTYEAAWVPFTVDRTIEAAAEIGIAWAERVAARNGRPAVLVSDQKNNTVGVDALGRYEDRHFTLRSSGGTTAGAVIAYLPSPHAMKLATRLAHGNALVVVELQIPWRLKGWARAAGAVDLPSGDRELGLDDGLKKQLETLEFYGNNGYPRGYGRDHALRVLREMQAEGQLGDRDMVLSALLVGKLSSDGLETLDKLITEVAGSRTCTA
ncbi:hypothetical protein [Dactylosporangium sp. CA-092794]|uniref:hypothetical protein n=1 Tax=Dactylosporangium sp. CA-092794 TaxID=3239929 RepID=UPI003D941A07